MMEKNPMQQALGEAWQQLPRALQAHYQTATNVDVGELSIEYPRWMQPVLNVLRLLGVLLNRRASSVPATVVKHMQGEVQYWERSINFADGHTIQFKSRWLYHGGNQIVEYVSPLLGLCMAVQVREGSLYYEGRYYVVKLGPLKLPLPEGLLLGHTTIVEQAVNEHSFSMDFRLHHPLFGQIYRYAGVFRTEMQG